MQSAINLARYQGRADPESDIEITTDLFRQVVNNRVQYKKAIEAIDGMNENAKARDSGWY